MGFWALHEVAATVHMASEKAAPIMLSIVVIIGSRRLAVRKTTLLGLGLFQPGTYGRWPPLYDGPEIDIVNRNGGDRWLFTGRTTREKKGRQAPPTTTK